MQLLGGKNKEIEIGGAVGITQDKNKLLEEISLKIEQGYKRIKLKIKPGWDIKPLEITFLMFLYSLMQSLLILYKI